MGITPEELGELMDQQWQPLLAWVGNCRGSEEDVVQEAFIRLACLASKPDKPTAWLYVVARNIAISQRTSDSRRDRRQRCVARSESLVESPDEVLDMKNLREALQQLPDPLCRAVVGKIWGGLTFQEIADLEEVSSATVCRRFHEALDFLRNRYGAICQNMND